MNDAILQRIRRVYAAIGAIEEDNPNRLVATVVNGDKVTTLFQDFRGGLSDDELSNQAHTVIHNIANLRDHLRRWAAQNGKDKTKIDQTVENSLELRLIMDLSNSDKHGYPPRDGGRSGRHPQLIEINRVMRLQVQGNNGSTIGMELPLTPDGIPRFFGDGAAKAVVTGDVVDGDNNRLGDLYDIAVTAVGGWETLLADFRLDCVKGGT
jgi:hypothetical protein